MSDSAAPVPKDFGLPRPIVWNGHRSIAGPGYASFTSKFGRAFPEPHFLDSDLGRTAIYELPPPSGQSKRAVMIVHGANTPALGMLALAKALQKLDPDAHVVLYDNWGHGLSSTPLLAHTPHIFHSQILQVLGFMQWTRAHFLGFSFGGATLMSFAVHHPWAVSSAVILGPAGLLQMEDFDPRMRELLIDSQGKESEAANVVLSWLEGGPLVVPEDWQEQAKSGKAVAEALREWEIQEHRGYSLSVLSLFRDGGVLGAEESIRAFAKLPLQKVGVVAELDPVCNKSQLTELGFSNVEVIQNEGHSFVRTVPAEVAGIVHQFWSGRLAEQPKQ